MDEVFCWKNMSEVVVVCSLLHNDQYGCVIQNSHASVLFSNLLPALVHQSVFVRMRMPLFLICLGQMVFVPCCPCCYCHDRKTWPEFCCSQYGMVWLSFKCTAWCVFERNVKSVWSVVASIGFQKDRRNA